LGVSPLPLRGYSDKANGFLSTPFWEFLEEVLSELKQLAEGIMTFYSLLGVSSLQDHLID